MKKGEIIDLMLKYPDRFKHIRTYGEPVKKIVIKKDNDIKPSMATKKIVIKRTPQQAKIILPKEKKAAMKAKLINKKMTITKKSGEVIELKKKEPKKIKTKIDSSKEIIREFEDFPDILPSKATRKIQIKKKPLKAKVIKPKKRTALKAKVFKAQKDKQSSKSKDEESSEEEEEEEEITLRTFKPIPVIPKPLKKIWFEYMDTRVGYFTKEDQDDEVEELVRVENNYIQADSNRKNKNLTAKIQLEAVKVIGQIIPKVVDDIDKNKDLIKLYKLFQPEILKNVLNQKKKDIADLKKEQNDIKKQEKADKKEYEKSLKE